MHFKVLAKVWHLQMANIKVKVVFTAYTLQSHEYLLIFYRGIQIILTCITVVER